MEIYCTACELSYLRPRYECIQNITKGLVLGLGLENKGRSKLMKMKFTVNIYIYVFYFLPEYEIFFSAPCLVHDTKNNWQYSLMQGKWSAWLITLHPIYTHIHVFYFLFNFLKYLPANSGFCGRTIMTRNFFPLLWAWIILFAMASTIWFLTPCFATEEQKNWFCRDQINFILIGPFDS